MPSPSRQFSEGSYHHIYNRGNHKLPVFQEEFDYRYFLRLVAINAEKYGVKIVAYCLMRNHYHFLVQAGSADSQIGKWIGCTTMSYVHYFNRKYGKVGHLFQDKFKSKLVQEDAYLYYLSQYIHNNPAEFTGPMDYPWSSIRDYFGRGDGLADPRPVLRYLNGRPYELQPAVTKAELQLA